MNRLTITHLTPRILALTCFVIFAIFNSGCRPSAEEESDLRHLLQASHAQAFADSQVLMALATNDLALAKSMMLGRLCEDVTDLEFAYSRVGKPDDLPGIREVLAGSVQVLTNVSLVKAFPLTNRLESAKQVLRKYGLLADRSN